MQSVQSRGRGFSVAFFLLSFFLFSGVLRAEGINITICSIADNGGAGRGGAWTLDGANGATLRSKILNAANFSPPGIDPTTFTIVDGFATSGSITVASLQANGCEVFFKGYVFDGDITTAERDAMFDWVNINGGTLLSFADNVQFNAFASRFGYGTTNSGATSWTVDPAALTHPIFDGPFGTASVLTTQAQKSYYNTSAGATVLATVTGNPAQPTMLDVSVGNGHAVFVGDVDVVTRQLSAGNGNNTDQDHATLNMFAYVAAVHNENNYTPPTPTITAPADGSITGDATPTVSGTADPGVTITVTGPLGETCMTTSDFTTGAWSCDIAPDLAEGSNVLSATATFGVNTSGADTVTITVDTVAPAAPTVTSPTDGSIGNDNTPTVTGTAEPGATVVVTGPLGETCNVVADINGDWSCTIAPPLADGSNQLDVTATDSAGNTSGTTSITTTIDTGVPAAPTIDTPTNGAPVTGTGEPGATVTVTTPSGATCTTTVQAGGTWSCNLSPSPVDGEDITADQTDPAGNTSPPTTVPGGVDTSAPAAPVITAPADGSDINDNTPTVVGTAEPGATVTVTGPLGETCNAVADINGDWSCTIAPALADGSNQLDATATDAAGNTSGTTSVTVDVDTAAPTAPTINTPTNGAPVSGTGEPGATVTVTTPSGSTCTTTVLGDGTWSCTLSPSPVDGEDITADQTDPAGNTSPPTTVPGGVDTSAPAAPVVTSPTDGSDINDNTPTVVGTAEPGATVTVTGPLGETCTAVADINGDWSCTIAPALTDGSNQLDVTATDAAGNTSGTTSVTVDVDTVAPTAPTINTPTNGAPVSGTGEPGATVTVTTPSGSTCTTTVLGDGTWSCTLSPSPVDGEDITADQTDPAGNTSPPTTIPGGVDTSAPAAPVVTAPADGSIGNDNTPTVVGTAEPGAEVTVTGPLGETCTAVADINGDWSCEIAPALAEGANQLDVTATDAAGNTSGTTSITTTIDTVAPAAPTINTPTNGAPVSGTGEAGATVTVTTPSGATCTTTVLANGTWSCTLSPSPVDGEDITADQTDPAGNTSPPTTVNGGVDTSAPAAPVVTAPADGSDINDNTPTVVGTAEPGATVTVTGPLGETCTAVADINGDWSCTIAPALAEGSNQLDVTATDDAGNTSGTTSVTVNVDTVAPTAPTINTPTNGAPVSGTGEPGATVTVTTPSGSTCTTTVLANGTWSCTLSPSPVDGEDITADQTDPAGNTSPPTTVNGGVDTSAPAAPVVTAPADGSIGNDNTPTVTGTAEPGATVTVTGPLGETCTAVADINGDWSCEIAPALAEGANQLDVTATDDAGNTSPATMVNITVDTIAPAAPTIGTPTNGAPVFGNGEPGATVTVTTPSGATCTTTVLGDGTWSCTLSPSPVDGEDITADQTDPAGNTSPPTTVNGGVDTSAPAAPVVTAPADGSIGNDNTPTVTGTAEPGAAITVTGPLGETCSTVVDINGDWSCEVFPALAEGANQLDVTATDAAGNTSGTTSITTTIDTVAPAAPTINTPTNGSPVSGTGEAGATVVVTTPSGANCTTVVLANGTWSCTLSPSPVDGEDITADQTDPAGNTSPPTTVPGGVDTSAPAAPVVTAPADGSIGNDNTPTVTGTAEPGATVVVTGPLGETCTAVADINGDWSCEIAPALAEGANQLDVTATDAAGNTSPATMVNITVDTMAPAAPTINTPTNGAPVSGTGEAGATVTVTTPSGATCTTTVLANGTWSCSLSPSPVDGEDITADQTDPAGNTSPPTTVPGGVDTSAPAAPVVTAPADGSIGNDNTPTVTGTAEPGATVTVTGPLGETCTAVADINGDWSCEIAPALAEGANQLDVTATDDAGNTSPATMVNITVDTIAPAAPTIGTPTNGAPVFGNGEPGATVTVTTPSGATCTTTVLGDGTWSCTLSPSPVDGEDITADQTDPAGNTSPPTTVNGGVDVSAPAAPVVTAPADGSIGNDNTPTVTGTAEPGAAITVTGPLGETCSTVADINGDWSCEVFPALAEGANQLDVTATDVAGNVSPATMVNITVDTVAPAAPTINTPTNGSPVSGTGEAGATVVVTTPSGATCTTVVLANGTWSCTLSPSPVDGEDITADQTDPAGNTSPPTTVNGGVDTSAPAAPVVTAPAEGSIGNDNTPTVTGTAEPGATVVVTGPLGETCTAVADINGDWSCEIAPALAEGANQLDVTATDDAGNTSPATMVNITVDTVAPAAPVINTPTNGAPVSGTGEAGATVVVTTPSGATCTTVVLANGTWSCTLSPSPGDGEDITADQTDPAGNTSPPTTVNGGVDTSAPAAPVITAPVDGSIGNDNTPTVTGTAEPGATVTVTGPLGETCTAVADINGDWSCEIAPALADGANQLDVTATDAAGNTSPATMVNITVDTMAPAAPVINTPTNGDPVSGTGEAGATVVVTTPSGATCTTVVLANGTWSCTLSPSPVDGEDITADQTDPAGNTSPPTTVNGGIDTTAPAAPVITAPVDGAIGNDNTPTVTGTAEPGATVTVIGPLGETCTAVADINGDWSCEIAPALADGLNQLDVTATDPAGNTSPVSSVMITVDTMAPAAPVINTPTNGAPVSGTGEAGATVVVTTPSGATCTTVVLANGTWSCTLSPSPVDGEDITADQTDPAGNTSPPTTVNGGIDTTAPAAPVITAPVDGAIGNDNTPTVTGTAEPGATVTVTGPLGETCTAVADINGDWSCDIAPALQEGVNQLDATATDPAGNTSPVSSIMITVDTVAPAAPVINTPTNGDPVSGTGEAGATVVVTTPSGATCTTVVLANGTWSCTLSPSPVDGEDITADQTDEAGNTSPPTTVSGGIDTVAPVAPVITAPVDGAIGNNNTPTVVGTAEPGATVTVTGPLGETCTAVADINGDWSCTIAPALQEGVNQLDATATDPAGNTSPADSISITVDTVAPAGPVITAPADGSSINDNTPTVSGTAEPGATVVVTGPLGETCMAVADINGDWSCDIAPALAEGSNVLSATATDAAGNTSSASAVTVTVDTAAPAAPVITAPTAGELTNDNTPTVSGTAEPGATVTVTGPLGETCTAVADINGDWSCDIAPALQEGSNQLDAVASDAAGNDSAPTSVTITVDTVAPAAPVITTPTNGAPVSGTGEAGATVVVTTPSGATCTTTVLPDGTWSCTLSPAPVDGEDITAEQTDEAGNTSPPTTVNGGIDTTPPAAPVITAPVDGSTINNKTPTVAGTAEPGATVVVTGPLGETCSAVADINGDWSCDIAPALQDGANQLTAVATDPAGNDSQPATVDITVVVGGTYGVVITPDTERVTTEMGGTSTFDVSLTLTPSADVTLNLSSSDTTEGTIDVSTVVFTPSNWDEPVTITITGVDDPDFDMDQNYQIITDALTSTDTNYDGINPDDVDAVNIDDDRNPDLSVFLTNCVSDVRPDGDVTYNLFVNNVGNVDITGAAVETMLTDLMTTPAWSCDATGGASCNNLSGMGDLNETVDLPVGSQLQYVFDATVTADLTDFLDSTATVTMPSSETDTNPADNMAEDSDLTIQFLFKSNFECDPPGTIQSTTQQLEDWLLSQ